MGDLLLHSTVVWLNPPASLVKSKKDPHLVAFGEHTFCERFCGRDVTAIFINVSVGFLLCFNFYKNELVSLLKKQKTKPTVCPGVFL